MSEDSKDFNKLLIEVYNRFKDEPEPPIPIKEVKELLSLDGIELKTEEQDKKGADTNE
jgi:hypothetical protein